MTLLIAGVVLWSAVHLIPSVTPALRANLAGKFGAGPFKGLFALDIVIALALIIFGWKSATPESIYAPPMYGSPIPSVFLVLAVLLLVASSTPNNLRRVVRHPQMAAVVFWGIGHLLTNGDSRSIVLFGGLCIWAVLEMIFINRRDGQWERPAAVSHLKDAIAALAAAAVFAGLTYFHASWFGVSPLPA